MNPAVEDELNKASNAAETLRDEDENVLNKSCVCRPDESIGKESNSNWQVNESSVSGLNGWWLKNES